MPVPSGDPFRVVSGTSTLRVWILICSKNRVTTWVACSLHGSGCDKSGCHNLGRAMAENMLQSGIVKVHWDQRGKKYHGKVKAFVDAIVAGGVSFKESAPFTA